MKTVSAFAGALAIGFGGSAMADLLHIDINQVFDENNPIALSFDFDGVSAHDYVEIKSIGIEIEHTFAGDIEFTVGSPGGVFNLADNEGGGDDLGGIYEFVQAGGSDNAWPVDGVGPYNANGWVAGPISGDGWNVQLNDTFGGDEGYVTAVWIDYNVVPAPGAMALLGLAGVAGMRRRRRA